jgi:hypothetical protein
MNPSSSFRIFLSFVLIAIFSLASGCAMPQSFPSSTDAADAFVDALRAHDRKELRKILGSDADELLYSGDDVMDRHRADTFVAAYDVRNQLIYSSDGRVTLIVGEDNWPLPIPIVKNQWGNDWHFDMKAAREEILNRRIGNNELNAIQVCLAVVDAQREYAALDPEKIGGGKMIFAQKFLSDEGKKNGLFWPTREGETPSPLGPLIVAAHSEGYRRKEGGRTPYHGYYYRILTSQGSFAPGGAQDYLVDGKLTKGFAILAWPAAYGDSGIASFMVSHNGIIYSGDFGTETDKIASEMKSFDPDPDWWPVTDAQMVIVK